MYTLLKFNSLESKLNCFVQTFTRFRTFIFKVHLGKPFDHIHKHHAQRMTKVWKTTKLENIFMAPSSNCRLGLPPVVLHSNLNNR